MPEFIIHSGKLQGKKLVLPATEVIIGRGDECQIRLASNDISRTHCSIQQKPEGLFVRDLESRNGTFVNNIPISRETELRPGDLLRVGPLELRVPGEPPATARTASPMPQKKPLSSAEIRIPSKRNRGASDDEIAEWLTPQIPGGHEAPSSDTTIIPGGSRRNKDEREITPLTPAPSDGPPSLAAEPPSPQRKKFHSVAEEGADIIRRHWEAIKNLGQ